MPHDTEPHDTEWDDHESSQPRSRLSDLRAKLGARMADMNIRTVVENIKTVVETLQVHFPPLQEWHHFARQTYLRTRRQPFDADFQCLASIGFAPDDVMIDIGASRGQSIDAMRLYHPGQPLVAFEPNPGLAARLRSQCEDDPNLVVHNVGLSDAAGEFTLYIPSYNGVDFDGEAALTFGDHQWRDIRESIIGFDRSRMSYKKIRCQVWQLDRFKLKARFIKIDTIGCELSVLQGAIETIKAHHPILLIANTSPHEIFKLLEPMGYGEFHYKDRFCQGKGIRNTLYIHLDA
jgi:FkbM family methyltransferase